MPLDRRALLLSLSTTLAGALLAERGLARAALVLPGDDQSAAFLAAVRAGDLVRVRELLGSTPALARARDGAGRSAYLIAQLERQAEVAQLLRDTGLQLDLVESVLAEDWERAAELVAAAPGGVDALHPVGGTPLYAAALLGRGELYRLRSFGCDPDAAPAGGSGFTPARAALECREPVGAWCALTDLLGNGGDVNAPQREGSSVLHGAVARRDTTLVRLALRKGADCESRDARERTPLELARELEWSAGVALLEGQADVARDHGTSRLRWNAARERVEFPDMSYMTQAQQSEVTGSSHANLKRIAELLKADPRATFSISTDAELAIEACGHTGFRPIIQLHLDCGAPLSLPTAISLGDLDHARFLLAEDPLRVHERGPHDFALMWYAAIGGGSLEAAELLLEAGTPIDQESVGETCLHWAVQRKHSDLARYLVERGAFLDAVSYRSERAGITPLGLARKLGRDDCARLLADAGASATVG